MKSCDISVVIPSYQRSELVASLLKSLLEARKAYQYGLCEVLVIDSSSGQEREKIIAACQDFDCQYLPGTDSVRQKRNAGIRAAQYPYILFLDSDVIVDRELLNMHAQTYRNAAGNHKIAGSFGLTTFTGEDTFVWKVIQYTTLTDSFSFAKRWPYQTWTIGNNVSYKKSVLEEVHLFEENFPFRLGADDLDLSYRITRAGYLIQSQPDAVTYHTKKTWEKWSLVRERSFRWGRMEYYLSRRHPQIFINKTPSTLFIAPLLFAAFLLLCLASATPGPLYAYLLWLFLTLCGSWFLKTRGSAQKNPLYFWPARVLDAFYDAGHALEGFKHASLDGLYKQMSFSAGQTKMILRQEANRIAMILINLMIAALFLILREGV